MSREWLDCAYQGSNAAISAIEGGGAWIASSPAPPRPENRYDPAWRPRRREREQNDPGRPHAIRKAREHEQLRARRTAAVFRVLSAPRDDDRRRRRNARVRRFAFGCRFACRRRAGSHGPRALIPAYGLELPDERRGESQIRRVELMLRTLLARDERRLSAARPVGERLVVVCRHFTVLLVTMLRAKGVPARARCGFAAYFFPGRYEDHWVCEYWNSGRRQSILVDAQIDAFQKDMFKPQFDLLDVPRDQFLVAGEAWARCRAGEADPQTIRRFRYARPDRGRAEPGARLRGAEQHGNASVGRLGSDAPRDASIRRRSRAFRPPRRAYAQT